MPRPRKDSSQLILIGTTKGRVVCGGPCVSEGFGCGVKSEIVTIRSPAAPALVIVEDLPGWSSDAGSIWGMMLGLSILCPKCTDKARGVETPPPRKKKS